VTDSVPLLSPRAFSEYSAAEFLTHVRTLYVEPVRAAPPAEYSVRLNAKLNPVITIRRKPKWLTSAEVGAIAEELSWSLQKLWLHLLKKKVELRVPKKVRK
jgi:hypothetical protein